MDLKKFEEFSKLLKLADTWEEELNRWRRIARENSSESSQIALGVSFVNYMMDLNVNFSSTSYEDSIRSDFFRALNDLRGGRFCAPSKELELHLLSILEKKSVEDFFNFPPSKPNPDEYNFSYEIVQGMKAAYKYFNT